MSLHSPQSPDLTVSFYLLKNCKLWVWDFDDTIIDSTTYIKCKMEPNAIRNRTDFELDDEVPQWKYFKRLIEFLVMHGKYIGIASFGTYEIIKAYMDRILGFNQKFFNKKNIIAPCRVDRDLRTFTVPPNKNEYIYKLMQAYRVQDFKRVVLFDDLASNIADGIGVGIIAIQIPTPRNGDIDISKMFFGPWIMDSFDRKIENDCGKELYLNRTFTGVSNKDTPNNRLHYLGTSYDKIDFGTGIDTDSHPYVSTAFGSGIGDRKISKKPEYRWNKMNVTTPPLWKNENWLTKEQTQDKSNTCLESWNEYGLGGFTPSFWDTHQSLSGSSSKSNSSSNSIRNKHPSNPSNPNNPSNPSLYEGFEDYTTNINTNTSNSGDVNASCNTCGKLSWSWITLSLIVVIAMMAVIVFNVM